MSDIQDAVGGHQVRAERIRAWPRRGYRNRELRGRS